MTAADVSTSWLREVVETVGIPRHFEQQPENNRFVRDWLDEQLKSYGYQTRFQGPFQNLLTTPSDPARPLILVGAHYDSKPQTPGADDNASALAALLACARTVAHNAPQTAVCFAAFNREEDNLLGSKDFVANFLPGSGWAIAESHILEMVGYRDRNPGSQRVPTGLPIRSLDAGDFLGVLGNRRSLRLLTRILRCARGYTPELPVIGLKIYCGMEKWFKVVLRSDHAPLWEAGIPALMWTDTAEFRNPHYHQPTDTPDTLDYEFLREVTRLLIAQVMVSGAN